LVFLKVIEKVFIFVKKLKMVAEPKKLTNLQIELLKVFSYDLSDAALLEIKALLSNYFAQKATDRMDELWEIKGWTAETMKQWGQEHLRTQQHG
jgi:hypothetical protein